MPKVRDASGAEQREATRYFLDLDVNYTVFDWGDGGNSGRGRTIDLSSSGLRFAAEQPIAVGLKIDLAVRWPVTLDGGVPLQLLASGVVVRVDDGKAAVRILRYEFRTGRLHLDATERQSARWSQWR